MCARYTHDIVGPGGEKLPSEPDYSRFDRPLAAEPTPTQIRIEALRAAAQSIGAVWGGIAQAAIGTGDPSKHITDEKVRQSVIDAANQFVKWLETGE